MEQADQSDRTKDRMRYLLERWEGNVDPRAGFLKCYFAMTSNMIDALDRGVFRDVVWVRTLLDCFADYYFDALHAYDRGDASMSAVWRQAHDITLKKPPFIVQRLLLGINAHINYDLVFALVDVLRDEWAVLTPMQRGMRYADHCAVNAVIESSIDAVQDEIIEHEEPVMELLDALLGRMDEWAISHIISHWRDDVWRNALAILEAPDPGECERIRLRVEANTMRRADAILIFRRAS